MYTYEIIHDISLLNKKIGSIVHISFMSYSTNDQLQSNHICLEKVIYELERKLDLFYLIMTIIKRTTDETYKYNNIYNLLSVTIIFGDYVFFFFSYMKTQKTSFIDL